VDVEGPGDEVVTTAFNASAARPYSHLAPNYDHSVGIPFFHRTRRIFERLICRYGITFRSAADIGCGTGLFARYLNQNWRVPVFGVDLSTEMLRIAFRHCRGFNVCLLRQDIRYLRLPRRVDLITCNFDTLNHLVGDGDLLSTFRHIKSNLKPNGHLIFDMVLHCRPLGNANRYVRRFEVGDRFVTQDVRWQPWKRLLTITVSVVAPGRCAPTIERHQERAYSPREIADALHDAGFTIRGVHDSETLAPAARCSPRIVVVAVKRGQ
jgi:SAM-dependent methyltransferase